MAVAVLFGGCGRAKVEEQPASVVSPGVADRGELCADIADVRACWGAELTGPGCAGGACLVERTVPAFPSASGWRCDGQGAGRACSARASRSTPFVCSKGAGGKDDAAWRCVQRQPRLPDDGEWDCAEVDGVVRCTGGQAASGVVAGPPDPGWLCGPRRGSSERICVDFSPDVPERGISPVEPAAWRCGYDRSGNLTRFCVPGGAVRRLGGACTAPADCPAASICAGGRCLPRRPEPACYLDGDCGGGAACRFGTCAPRSG